MNTSETAIQALECGIVLRLPTDGPDLHFLSVILGPPPIRFEARRWLCFSTGDSPMTSHLVSSEENALLRLDARLVGEQDFAVDDLELRLVLGVHNAVPSACRV